MESHNSNTKKGEKLLALLTSMIFYLQNTDLESNTSLSEAVDKMKKFVEVEKTLKHFLRNNSDFTLEKLVEIFNYVEKISWENIKENVSADYKNNLTEKIKEQTDKFYLKFKDEIIIKKQHLATAARRFVSRFLIKEDDFDKDKELIYILSFKEEFWKKEVFEDQKFEEEIALFIEFIANNNDKNSNNNENNEIRIC